MVNEGKLKCTYSQDTNFTNNCEYALIRKYTKDNYFLYVIIDNRGTERSVSLDGRVWKFEIVEDIEEVLVPRDSQIYAREVINWEAINLLEDEDSQGHRLLSRADLILIFTLYNRRGLDGFLEEYISYANNFISEYGDGAIIKKPHYYLKSIIG